MKALVTLLVALACSVQAAVKINPAQDWPGWRGPTGDGIAAAGQNPPVVWSEGQNIVWKTPIPGRGHGSPIVVGDKIFLATADPAKGSQSVLCLEQRSGKVIWDRVVHPDKADAGKHANSSAASSSLACDGERVFINFLNGGAVYTSALDLDGKILWQRKVCDYVTHQGFGSSPVVYEGLVLVSADHRGGGTVAGLDRKSGEIIWSVERPKIANYPSPGIIRANGKTQMVLEGCNQVLSLDPASGKKLWEIAGSTEECVTTAVSDGTRVFVSGGYPRNHLAAIIADGSGKIAWENNTRVYVPSMLVKDGHLFAVTDAGIAICWKSDTGAEVWKERLGGDFYASPVMVDDRIFASNLAGKTYVFEAKPSGFRMLAQNQIGDEIYPSPVICGSRIYLRVAKKGEKREEFLYCIGNPGGV